MNEKKAYDDKGNGNKWNPIVIGVISALVGSGGAISIVFGTPVGETLARPDPFTGKQAYALEQRVTRLEDEINPHLANYPQVLASFESRVAVLESQYQQIISNQNRILDRLDGR